MWGYCFEITDFRSSLEWKRGLRMELGGRGYGRNPGSPTRVLLSVPPGGGGAVSKRGPRRFSSCGPVLAVHSQAAPWKTDDRRLGGRRRQVAWVGKGRAGMTEGMGGLKESLGLEKKTTVSKALTESSNFGENRIEL